MSGKLGAFVRLVLWGAVLFGIGYRAYRLVIPEGASFTAWLFDRIEIGTFPSPDGTLEVTVSAEDQGDAKGGNYRTWVVYNDLVWGRQVILEGWSEHEIVRKRKEFPLKWIGSDTVEVQFLDNEIGGKLVPKRALVRKDS